MCQWKGEEVGVGEELGVWTAFRPRKLESTRRYHLRPEPELLLYIDLLEQMFYSARHFFDPDSILNYLLLLFFINQLSNFPDFPWINFLYLRHFNLLTEDFVSG